MISSLYGKNETISNQHIRFSSEINVRLNDFLTENRIVDDRIYLETNLIYIHPKGIFLNFTGQLLQVRSLSSDENGVFISLEELKAGFWGDTWICPNSNCGYENYNAVRYCGICGTERS